MRYLFLIVLLLSACNAIEADESCITGEVRCSCYPNDTCNDGLVCLSDLCVAAGDSDGQTDETSDGDSTVSDGDAPSEKELDGDLASETDLDALDGDADTEGEKESGDGNCDKFVLLRDSLDKGCTGVLESCNEYTHDQYGNIIKKDHDRFCDDSIDSIVCYQIDYDPLEERIRSESSSTCGSEYFYCYEYTYDDNGLLISQKYDRDCSDEALPECTTFEYENGCLYKSVSDSCGQYYTGFSKYFCDSSGNIIKKEEYSGIEGPDEILHYRYEWTHDDKGNILKETRTYYLSTPNQVRAICYSYTYDTYGNIVHTRVDEDCNEIANCWEYEYGCL